MEGLRERMGERGQGPSFALTSIFYWGMFASWNHTPSWCSVLASIPSQGKTQIRLMLKLWQWRARTLGLISLIMAQCGLIVADKLLSGSLKVLHTIGKMITLVKAVHQRLKVQQQLIFSLSRFLWRRCLAWAVHNDSKWDQNSPSQCDCDACEESTYKKYSVTSHGPQKHQWLTRPWT